MSGFALIYARDGAPVEQEQLTRMLARLRHRGPDGCRQHVQGQIGLGFQHFYTTPEAVGQPQPLAGGAGQVHVMLDGRLDYRADLIARLGLDRDALALPDTALALLAYERWQTTCVEHLEGAFALVIYDSARQHVLCVRDSIGECTLFYHLAHRLFLAASEEQAILAHPAVPTRLDTASQAEYFALLPPAGEHTLFENISELPPAHALLVSSEGVRKWRYWQPASGLDAGQTLHYRSDEEYAEHYRALLEDTIQVQLRSNTQPAIMMSGGLDSTSVAALAARHISAGPSPLRTVSYFFDAFPQCDERMYIDEITRHYNTEPVLVPGDDAWPLTAPGEAIHNPNAPDFIPYRVMRSRVYAASGTRVILDGLFGDHLYFASHPSWLVDLLRDRKFAQIRREISLLGRGWGWRKTWRDEPGVRRLGSRVLDIIPYSRRIFRRSQSLPFPWLTQAARNQLRQKQQFPGHPALTRSQAEMRLGVLLDEQVTSQTTRELFFAHQARVEVRHPYRDRRVIEFMLSIPGYQSYQHGLFKYILRKAMRGILPERVRLRTQPTSLLPFYRQHLLETSRTQVEQLLFSPTSRCRSFVNPGWLKDVALPCIVNQQDGPETLVPWFCIAYERWHQPN